MTARQKSIVVVVALAVVGMLTVGMSGGVIAQEGTPTPTPADGAEAATVTVDNQTSNGTAFIVNETNLAEGGFLVAYNSSMAAPIGNSSFVQSGMQQDVKVTLNQTLTQNTTVVVVAFQDTNGNQQFDLGTDEVYLSDQRPVVDTAQVNVTA